MGSRRNKILGNKKVIQDNFFRWVLFYSKVKKSGYKSKSAGVKGFIKVRDHFRADGSDPLDGETLQE